MSSSQIANSFKELLKDVNFSEKPLIIKDPFELKRFLERKLPEKSQIAQEFCYGFNQHIKEKTFLQKILIPYKTTAQVLNSYDTLCKILLNISSLQTNLTAILLEQIPEYAKDE